MFRGRNPSSNSKSSHNNNVFILTKKENTSGSELLLARSMPQQQQSSDIENLTATTSSTPPTNKTVDQQTTDDEDRGIDQLERRATSNSIGLEKAKGGCLCLGRKLVAILGDDWIHLVLLGILMGVFSFTIDLCAGKLRWLHEYTTHLAGSVNWFMQYSTWVLFSVIMILMSTSLCHYIAPQAAGSGIPEMKTILRGVVLKEYLTWKTLVTKFVGLVLALGSDLPLGQEGPFVHIASMLARLLSKLVVSFQGIYENESRSSEMLAAACAVGIASTYGAPVGGVLFSIEVTSVFFPLRNYWRGFLSTVCSAITFRLLLVWSGQTDTVVAFSVTQFPSDYPFDPKELIFFALIGLSCGFLGALFVWTHQKYVRYVLQNVRIKRLMQRYFLAYPAIVTIIIASLKCPLGYGKYFTAGLTPREAVRHLSSNFSWTESNVANDTNAEALLQFWRSDGTSSIFLLLFLFACNMFWMTFVANTIPVPCGVFIPVFVTGAAFGRLVGEALYILFPEGVRTDGIVTKLVPGAYALVGATAFAGAVTHAISTSVIVVEMTGQIIYILPLTLAVLLANAVCARLQPSIYDSIIQLKKLPYLPQISPTSSAVHRLYVADFAVKDVKFLSLCSTYRELRDLLLAMPKLKSFPLVDAPSSRILLGSIRRSRLARLLDAHIGEEARRRVLTIKRRKAAAEQAAFVQQQQLQQQQQQQTPELLLNGSGGTSAEVVDPTTLLAPPAAAETQNQQPQSQLQRFSIRRVRSCDTLAEVPSSGTGGVGGGAEIEHRLTPNGPDRSDSAYAAPDHHYHTICAAEPRRSRSFLIALGNYMQELPQRLRRSFKKHSPTEDEGMMSSSELLEWQTQRLNDRLNFEYLKVDPAPFQLVQRTSLSKAHSLFWILGLNRAYVTCLGRLVGVVALRELRQALERAQVNEVSRTASRTTTNTTTGGASTGPSEGPMARLRRRFHHHRNNHRRRPPSLNRHASTTTSASLVPGQAEALNVAIDFSLPSSPDPGTAAASIAGHSRHTTTEIDRSLFDCDSLITASGAAAGVRTARRDGSSFSLYENARSSLMREDEKQSSDDENDECDFVSYDGSGSEDDDEHDYMRGTLV